jgi:hypothetical protein
LITRTLFNDQRAWFDRTDHEPKNFDTRLCKLLYTSGFELQLLYPYICQHMGIVSKVRPDVAFYRDDRGAGRVGLGASGAYVIAENARSFVDLSSKVAAH